MKVLVKRRWYSDRSTIGEMWVDDQFECYTLELPWHDNQHGISCVPGGTYEVTFYFSPGKHYLVPLVNNVPDRSEIEIHIGNRPEDVKGCTAVGRGHTTDWVSESKEAFASLMTLLRSTVEPITITYVDFPEACGAGINPELCV